MHARTHTACTHTHTHPHTQAISGSVKLYGCDRPGDAGPAEDLFSDPGRLGDRPTPDLLPALRRADLDRLAAGFDEA